MKHLTWLTDATNKRQSLKRGRRRMSSLMLHLCPDGGLEPFWHWQWEISQSEVKCLQPLEQVPSPYLYHLFPQCFVIRDKKNFHPHKALILFQTCFGNTTVLFNDFFLYCTDMLNRSYYKKWQIAICKENIQCWTAHFHFILVKNLYFH